MSHTIEIDSLEDIYFIYLIVRHLMARSLTGTIKNQHHEEIIMGQNIERTTRKALAYLICCDIVKGAITNIGTANSADGRKTSMIVFEEVKAAAISQKKD